MSERRAVVVVGGGAMGSATAWHLARRGRDVVLLERFGPRHAMGASHGRSRNFNNTYDDPVHQRMVQEARGHWLDLEAASGASLLAQVGIASHGAGIAPDAAETLRSLGAQASMVSPAEAAERWPGVRWDTRVLLTPEGGRLDAEEAVAALQGEAARHGAEVRLECPARFLQVRADGLVEVVTDDTTYVAEQVVVTLGAWTEKLAGHLLPLPRLVVTEELPAHFVPRSADAEWPSFNHLPLAGDPTYDAWPAQVYGMHTPGEGVKAGWHAVGPEVDPDRRTFEPEPRMLALLQDYVREWMPGLDADAVAPISCTYTTTPDHEFVLDRVGPVVVGCGFSGHGFKFVPTVGRILADLVDGTARADPIFALARRSARRTLES